jgi:hypothetical protein
MQIFLTFLWLWQGVPITTSEPVSNSFWGAVLIALIVGFILGVLITALFFALKNSRTNTTTAKNEMPLALETEPRISIKQCPKCHSTYTDEDLVYCLRDGLTLKIVGSMPIPVDPDKTREFRS